MMWLLTLVCCLVATLPVFAWGGGQPRTAREADSLRRVYDILWKRSDSLRIEAMVARMRSDSLRRGAVRALPREEMPPPSADDDIMEAIRQRAAVESARQRQRSAKPGTSVADTVTAMAMAVTPDTGTASYYGADFHGRRMSNGKVYDMHALTCAHRWLPFGTILRVTNLANGTSVDVVVADRGPWKHGRIVDLSLAAAKALDMIRSGTTRVHIVVVPEEVDD